MNDEIVQDFLAAADAWVCDGYSSDIRYLCKVGDGGVTIWDSSVTLNPLPATQDLSFRVESANFMIGQLQRSAEKKKVLLRLLSAATNGALELLDKRLTLSLDQPLHIYSEMIHRDRWYSELHLHVSGSISPMLPSTELSRIDNILRSSQPPFDGLTDAAAWLGLSDPATANQPSISIRVGPPVDMIYERSSLTDDRLRLTLHAHPRLDIGRIGLAVRAIPGNGLDGRRQVSSEIKWGRARDGRREGVAEITLQNADNVLAILMIENSLVRRQWFVDSTKARNNRLIATQHFDKDLRMIRQAVMESPDSVKFEQGVAALLFLLGFSASIQLETDSPDLIVTTPGGRLVIAECTVRTSNFIEKVGKLVDRRGALSRSLSASGHPAPIFAVLVCRLPRDQIAVHAEVLRAQNVLLATGEDLTRAFDRVRFPTDPDRMLDEALDQVAGDAGPRYRE